MTPSTSSIRRDSLSVFKKATATGKPSGSIYVLEDRREFRRLEEQGKREGYRCVEEFNHIELPDHSVVLDAGCGSGLLSRYFSDRFPAATILGVDSSEDRVAEAEKAAASYKNIGFHCANLRSLPFVDESFDFIFCRYVIHHMPNAATDRVETLREFYRCLKPGGKLVVVEPDAMFYNLFPQTKAIERAFATFQEKGPVDLCVGRKLGELLSETGFMIHDWRALPMVSRKDLLSQEYELMAERFDILMKTLETMLGGSENAEQFRDEFLEALRRPETIYYCNKLVVTGMKAP